MTQLNQQKLDVKEFIMLSARLTAAMRSRITARCDRIFCDPCAAQLAGAEAFAFLEELKTKPEQDARPYVVVRTRFFDDFLLAKQVPQVVILASGMDARAFRLPWSKDTKVYELDQPEVLNYKPAILKDTPPCQHYAIAADLTQPWAHLLLAQGYCADKPSIWLIEGLLMYLNFSQVHSLLAEVSALTVAGSWLGLDLLNVKAISATVDGFQGYWQSGFDNPEELLAGYGWEATAIQPGDDGANFGRYTRKLPPRDVPDVERVFLVTACKK